MIFQGSPRNPKNCPDQWGKTMLLANYLVANAPEDVEIDFCDLSVRSDVSIVQPCKGCYSTGGGFHCHFPCDCYVANNKAHPDLMHDLGASETLNITRMRNMCCVSSAAAAPI